MNNQNTQNPQTWLEEIKTRRIDFSPFTEDLSNDPNYIEMKAHQREQATRPDIFKGANLKVWGNIFVVLGVLTFIIPPLGFIFLVIGAVLHSFLPSGVISDEKFIRHNNFIFRNGLRFSQTLPTDSVFSVFERATNPLKINIYQKQNFEFGHFRYFTDSEKTYTRNTFYVQQTLPFEVQNLIIDSRATDEFTVGRIKNPNIVSLEGDFNQYFTIETEASRKSQATAFLAPDLMSMLIDYFQGCEIEFFDNKVRIYFPSQISSDLLDVDKVEKNLIHAETFLKNFAEKFKLLEVSRTEFEILEDQKISHTRGIFTNTLVNFFSTILVVGALIVMVMVSYREQIMANPIALIAYCAITAVIFSIIAISGIDLIKTHIKTKNSGAFVARVRAKKYINPWKSFVIIFGIFILMLALVRINIYSVSSKERRRKKEALKIARYQEKLDRSKSQAKILKDSIIWHVRTRGDLAYFSKKSAGDIKTYRYYTLRSMKRDLDHKEANHPNLGGQICYHFRLEDEKYSIWRDFVIINFEEKSEYYLTEVNYSERSDIPANCQKI